MTAAAGGGADAMAAATGGKAAAAAAPGASPSPAAGAEDSQKADELRRLHTELGAFVPELHQVGQLLEASLALGEASEVAPQLRQRLRQCEVAAVVLSSPLIVVPGREERDLEALHSIKAFIDDSVTTLRDHKALAEALAGPGSELYRGASFGTTQQQWRQCGVLVQQNAWQYSHLNGMGVASTAARQFPAEHQPGQPPQQPLSPEHDHVQMQLLPRAPPAMVPQPGFAGPAQPELVHHPNLPLLPVVQPAPAPLGLALLQQEGKRPPEPAAAAEADQSTLWPNGASLRLEDFSFGRSIEMLPLLGSLEGLPSLGQLLEEPLMNVSMRMMSIREDEEFHWTDPAAAAAAAAAVVAGAAQQQRQQAGAGGGVDAAGGALPPGASAFAGLPPISTGADGGGPPAGPLGLLPSPLGSGELEVSGEHPYRSVSFRDLGRGPPGPDQGGTPSSTKSGTGNGRSLFARPPPGSMPQGLPSAAGGQLR